MFAMPKIWLDYAKFLQKQKKITQVRQTYDKALQSLPSTQHGLIWSESLKWSIGLARQNKRFAPIAQNVYRRYLKLKPDKTQEYLEFLLEMDLLEDSLTLYT